MGINPQIHIFNETSQLTHWVIHRWRGIAMDSIRDRGIVAIGLSGGKTPAFLYTQLSREKKFPWDETHIFLVDERYVDMKDPNSNFRMIQETLLSGGNVPPDNIHPMPVHRDSPQEVAWEYEKHLKRFFSLKGKELPVFDLLLLGIGQDGHTASLFSRVEFSIQGRLAIPVSRSKLKHRRMSLSLPVINNAAHVFFLVKGKNKAKILKQVLAGDEELPAAMVKPTRGKTTFIIDVEAAHYSFGAQ